jgi:TetR/AcrR family transcriptional repressor of nem operon
MPRSTAKPGARPKLLAAALSVIRTKGYSATSVDELCAAAGVTKGAFFHHFKSKDELGVAAADHWTETTGARFAAAPYHDHATPLDRILGYLADSIDHLRRYIELLFGVGTERTQHRTDGDST